MPKGERRETTDPVIAETLVAKRLAELQELKRNKNVLGIERQTTLASFAAHHLVRKAEAGRVTEGWLTETQKHLESAIAFFCNDGDPLPRDPKTDEILLENINDRDLRAITVPEVEAWKSWLAKRPGKREGSFLSGGTIRHYLNALSNLYQRAQSEGYVAPGYNPVAALIEKPTAKRQEARWLEVHEAALLLEAARLYKPRSGRGAPSFLHPLLATFLLTGGRKSEVLGLEVEDISFDRKTITFRPNGTRGLKTATSRRTVRMWPQLEKILRKYVFGGDKPLGALLFPSDRVAGEGKVWDLRKSLADVARRAGIDPDRVHLHALRHTYCAARLQTLDNGHPVSPFTVAKELGHGGTALVERIYGHLGEVRHRSEVVEFRVEQHRKILGDRLKELRTRSRGAK